MALISIRDDDRKDIPGFLLDAKPPASADPTSISVVARPCCSNMGLLSPEIGAWMNLLQAIRRADTARYPFGTSSDYDIYIRQRTHI
jgi:hypothetical protein